MHKSFSDCGLNDIYASDAIMRKHVSEIPCSPGVQQHDSMLPLLY